jgi:hypothetical protein
MKIIWFHYFETRTNFFDKLHQEKESILKMCSRCFWNTKLNVRDFDQKISYSFDQTIKFLSKKININRNSLKFKVMILDLELKALPCCFFISTSNFEVPKLLFELSDQQIIYQRKPLDCLIKCRSSRKIPAMHARENIISRKIFTLFHSHFPSYDEFFWMNTFSWITFASFLSNVKRIYGPNQSLKKFFNMNQLK